MRQIQDARVLTIHPFSMDDQYSGASRVPSLVPFFYPQLHTDKWLDDMVHDASENAGQCSGHQCANISPYSFQTPQCKKHALRNRVINAAAADKNKSQKSRKQ